MSASRHQSGGLPEHDADAILTAAEHLPNRCLRLVATRHRTAAACGNLAILLRRSMSRKSGPAGPLFFIVTTSYNTFVSVILGRCLTARRRISRQEKSDAALIVITSMAKP